MKKRFEQELHKSLSRKYNTNNQENEALMKSAIFVLDISNILSSTKYVFFHDDTQFLTTNWIKDSYFIQKYPSFVYWLIKYQKNTEKLQNIYSSLSFDKNHLPFWLFTLRLMSSQNCINLDSSTTISTIIAEAIIKYITRLSKLGTDWLSLVLSSVPSDIIVPNYRIFYEFFCHLFEDNKVNPEMLNDDIIKYISEFTENVCQMVLEKKTNEFLEKPFERLSENDWTFKNVIDQSLAFIYDPNKFINQQIKELIHSKYHDLRELSKRIKSDSIQVEDYLNMEISELEKSIEAEKNAKKESFLLGQKRDAELNIDSSADDDDDIPILIFGKTKTSDNFINELKSTINILSSFMEDIEEDIQNERITKEAFQKSKEIRNKFEEISLLLIANFTDNTECPTITYRLDGIKYIYSTLQRIADDFEKELNKTIRNYYSLFTNFSDDREFFSHQYQLPFPSQEKVITLENDISFDSFAGAEFSLPILSVEKDKENNKDIISCCFNSIECSIGPIIPSLYSGKCIMNFLSCINSPFLIEVKTDDDHKDWFQTKFVNNPGDPCQIFIKLPPSNESNKIESISVETILAMKLINSDLNSLEIPCKFNFIIVPLSILISCKEYPLSLSCNTFYLCAPNIHPNSKLTFQFENKYIKDSCKIAYQLNDFNDNDAEKPEVVYNRNENELFLMIKDAINATRLHCILIIRFSEDLDFVVEIDSIIAPSGSLKSINDINNHQQQPKEEQYASYLITINSEPTPHSKDQITGQIPSSSMQNNFSDYKIINIVLPEIVIPSNSEHKSLSIQSLSNFYKTCTEATKRFPFYVKNMLIQKSPEMQKTAKDYLLKLLQIYKHLPSKDYSFISASVNEFTCSFASMIKKFEKEGVDFHDLVPKKAILSEHNNQRLIQFPEKDQIILPQDNWKSNT